MITEDLIDYILAQTRKNIPKDTIASRLANAGWHQDDIDEAFRKIAPPVAVPPLIPPIAPKIEPPVVSAPENSPILSSENPIDAHIKPVFATGFKEAHKDVPKAATSYYIPDNATLAPGQKPASSAYAVSMRTPPAPAPIILDEQAQEIPIEKAAPTVSVPRVPPAAIPAMPVVSESKLPPIESVTVGSMPESVMLYSYPKDVSSKNRLSQTLNIRKKRGILKILAIIVAVFLIGGTVFAFLDGSFHFPSLGLVKKDPKSVLVNAPLDFSALKSYKIQTNATLSFPSFADISSGLITGNKVTSSDTDFIAVSGKGLVDNKDSSSILFDYAAKLSSSFFNKEIPTDLKYGGGLAFLAMPDLHQMLGSSAPPAGTILISDGQFEPLFQLLPTSVQNVIDKIDMHKLLSIGVPSYFNTDTEGIFKDFISSASVIEKAPEVINGIDTYHYELSADSISTKTFLTRFADVFLGDVSSSDKENLNSALGSIDIDSLEVWIGKKDSMIYQYKFSVSAPLSKLIGLDDQGIAGNVVHLDWKTTYSDFDVPNSIILPTDAISVTSFMNTVNDSNIMNQLSSFDALARTLHNAEGSYGKRSNPTGSCANPNPGSLFSPIGHPTGSTSAVGAIASSMNDILNLTNGSLSCFSTSDAWAMAAPLASQPNKYFCADSSGTTTTLAAPISGPACK